jgi:Tol biopolymer transport system component
LIAAFEDVTLGTVWSPAVDQTRKPRRRHGIFEGAIALAFAALVLLTGAYSQKPPALKAVAPPVRVVPFTNFPGFQGDARFSPDGDRIAFTWYGDKDYNEDIYVKQIGAEKPLRLTSDAATDESPAWSPDGRYIAFLRRGDGIYIVPALGGPERKVLATKDGFLDDSGLDWSPDGERLAYADRGPRRSEAIFLVAVDNPKDKHPLTASFGRWDYFPHFSPDGRTVAFVRFADTRDIFLVRVAGGEPKRLTFDDAIIYGLDWTPDGASIIFFSDRVGGIVRPWKVSASGGRPEPISMPPGEVEDPSLSRDGHRLAYTRRESNSNIWRYGVPQTNGQSTPPTKLIASAGYNSEPQFSPDGKRVAFVSSRSGNGEIWISDSDGSNSRQLTFSHVPIDAYPHWSPEGREIAFLASPEGYDAIYVVSSEGGHPRRLTLEGSEAAAPSWSRDGKWIYFGSNQTGSWQVWKVPPEGGQAVQVTKKGGFAALESPDGKTLYYAKRIHFPGWRKTEGLWKVPSDGGKETRVLKELGAGMYDCWDLTGEGIYFYNDNKSTIEFFSFATHGITQIAKTEKPDGSLAVSPDGRRILLDQVDLYTSHIMLVENFSW